MARHDKSYISSLRRTLLHSADITPMNVASYLAKIAHNRGWDARQQILDEYIPLVDHLPREFVDFVIDILKIKTKQMHTRSGKVIEYADESYDEGGHISNQSIDEPMLKLGLEDYLKFFPPAYFQGPFLYTLNKNPQEGLRLVHSLTNIATHKWRQREQNSRILGYSATPLPVNIHVQAGLHSFWGNQQVYSWFRSHGSGPNAVMSALMALEFWMEMQLKEERDAEDLFNIVLAGSDCVAVLGICLSLSLQFKHKCLKAVLPIIGSPAIWSMDIARASADQMGSYDINFLGFKEYIYEMRAERDRQPHRKMDVRQLATLFMFNSDPHIKEAFQEAVSHFMEELPYLYKEQRDSPEYIVELEQQMESYQLYADEANYRFEKRDDGGVIYVQPPPHIQSRNEPEVNRINSTLRYMQLSMWASKTIEAGTVDASMALTRAVAEAKELQQPNDFSARFDFDQHEEKIRVEAIAGVAAAILMVAFEWTQEQNIVDWSQSILLAAAQLPNENISMASRETVLLADPKISAGHGLGVLIAKGVATYAVKKQIYLLIADFHLQVVKTTFKSLYDSWKTEPVFCWNALSLGLSLSQSPRDNKVGMIPRKYAQVRFTERTGWIAQLVDRHLENDANDIKPVLPSISRSKKTDFHWNIAINTLCALPLQELLSDALMKPQLLKLTDDLMQWTITENMPEVGEHNYNHSAPFSWNMFFSSWLASLSLWISSDEAQRHVLQPIRNVWQDVPTLTGYLMLNFVERHLRREEITAKSLAEWNPVCHTGVRQNPVHEIV